MTSKPSKKSNRNALCSADALTCAEPLEIDGKAPVSFIVESFKGKDQRGNAKWLGLAHTLTSNAFSAMSAADGLRRATGQPTHYRVTMLPRAKRNAKELGL